MPSATSSARLWRKSYNTSKVSPYAQNYPTISSTYLILTHSQPNSIKLPILSIPPTIPNITTINRHSIPLTPRIIQLPNPIEAMWIVVCGFHLLFGGHLRGSGVSHVLGEDLVGGESELAVGRVLEVWSAGAEGVHG